MQGSELKPMDTEQEGIMKSKNLDCIPAAALRVKHMQVGVMDERATGRLYRITGPRR